MGEKTIFIALGILTFTVLVLAAPNIPTAYFEQNVTKNYDNDSIFSVNWTDSQSETISNYSVYVSIDGGAWSKYTNTSVKGYINATLTASQGNYSFKIAAVNTTGIEGTNSSQVWMVVDTTNPTLSYNSNTEINNGGANRTYIFVNVTATDTNNDTITFFLYNSTGLVYSNQTNYTITTINWTGLPNDEVYYFNVTVNDTATNSNSTSTRIFYLDGTNPTASAICSPSSVTAGASFPCTCTGSDNLAVSTSTGSSTSGSTSDTFSTGIFTYTCTVTDKAGNSVSATASYTVSSRSGGGSGTPSFWTMTYLEDDQELSEKVLVNRQLSEKHRIKLKIDGETHYVGVVELTGTTATINVSSGSQQAIWGIGDIKKFEINGDNVYDLNIILDGIDSNSNKADLTIVFIHEEIPAETKEVQGGAVITGKEIFEEEIQKKNPTKGWIIVAAVVIVAIVLFLKRKSKFSKFTDLETSPKVEGAKLEEKINYSICFTFNLI